MSSSYIKSSLSRAFLRTRLKYKLSQQAFADSLGIPLSDVQKYERGETRLPFNLIMYLIDINEADTLELFYESGTVLRENVDNEVLDLALMERAFKVVLSSVEESNKTISVGRFSHILMAVYSFYDKDSD